jgi:small conductance mechanosensitive channel
LIVAAILFAVSAHAGAPQPTPQPATPPANAEPSKSTTAPAAPAPITPLATQLGQTLETLVGTTAAQPASQASDNNDEFPGQLADTFAARVLGALGKTVDALKANSVLSKPHASFLSDLTDWITLQQSDPRRAALWLSIGQDLLVIVVAPVLIGTAFLLFFIPLRLKLKRNAPRTFVGRMSLVLGLLLLRLVPVLAFLGSSLLLLQQNEPHRLQQFILSDIIYAVALGYALQQVLRGLFAPTTPHLRALPLSTPQAFSGYRWLSAFCFVIVYSYFLVDTAAAVRVPAGVILVSQNFIALGLTGMAIIAIFRARRLIADILRGNPEEDSFTSFQAMRLWLAKHWHSLATVYLIISLIVTLLGDNSFSLMLRGTILSILILGAAHFCFIAIDKWKSGKSSGSLLIHRQVLSFLLRPAVWIAAALGISATWGVNVNAFIATPFGQRVLAATLSIALTLSVLTILYETVHSWIERYLSRRDKESKALVASARARTLLPMMRASLFIFFSAIALLTCLSAVGINIGPLLAGAGVIGVAIGFGSQTLVKDFLTGLFIVAENAIAVGDSVKIDSFGGTVETISIRTIRLRDIDGALHILPFSEVTKITNMTKGFAYALVDIGVAYDSDLEHTMRIMREVGATLQEDPVFKRVILEPIEVMGVQALETSSITIRARIRTRPGKQWEVRRLLLLRIKQRFDTENIEIPFPTVTHITKTAAAPSVTEAKN